MRNSEIIDVSSSVINVNKGETFKVSIVHTDAHTGTTTSLSISDDSILEFVSKNGNEYTYRAVGAGKAVVNLVTNNLAYDDITCDVYVGDGTVENPYFIRNYQDLSYIGNPPESMIGSYSLTSCYKQIADIDLSTVNANRWQPIGNGTEGFSGCYDGNGYTIYNLKITTPANIDDTEGFPENGFSINYAGLFSQITATGLVKNITLDTVTINDSNNICVGAIAGTNAGTIEYSNVTNALLNATNTNAYCGGITGTNIMSGTGSSARLDRVSFVGSIIGSNKLGGLTAINEGGIIINSYSKGTINPVLSTATMAGIACNNTYKTINADKYKSFIINCYSTMVVASNNGTMTSNKMGMIVYSNINPDTTITQLINQAGENRIYGCYYFTEQGFRGIYTEADNDSRYFTTNTTMAELTTVPNSDQLSAVASMATKSDEFAFISYANSSALVLWDFNKVWQISSTINNGLPTLRSVVVSSNENGVAVADRIYDIGDGTVLEIATLADLAPLCNGTGDMDGDYLLVANIYLTGAWTPIGTASNPFTGTFTVSTEGEAYYRIYNLLINGNYTHTGFFGYLGKNAQITGLTIDGIQITNGQYIGSISGYNSGVITDCSTFASTSGYNGMTINANCTTYLGGLVGLNDGTATGSKNNLTLDATSNGNTVYLGGVSAKNTGTLDSDLFNGAINGTISNGGKFIAGGIAGLNKYQITSCMARGNVITPNSNDNIAGGLVGELNADGKITLSSFAGNVTSATAGGLIGILTSYNSSYIAVSRCYSGSGLITGSMIGGLAGRMYVGEIADCYTLSNLSGSVMGGFSGTIEKNGSAYARVRHCFTAVRFDRSSGTAYCETSSEVRALTGYYVWDSLMGTGRDGYKVAGYVTDCIIDDEAGQHANRRVSTDRFLGSDPDGNYGTFSTADCYKLNTFTSRGFSTSYWTSDNESYPLLINVA